MKYLICFLLLVAHAEPEWLNDFSIAQEQAQKQNKLILISFSGSDWCGPCIKMKKEVFESSAFDSLSQQRLILVRADFPRSGKNQLPKDQIKKNEWLAEKYNPSGKFPFTVLTDASGKVIHQWDGYAFGSQSNFLQDLEKFTVQK